MKVARVVTLFLALLLVAAAAYPCQPEKSIDYYSDYFVTLVGWSWCGCQGQMAQSGQQSGAYRRVTTVGCLSGIETEKCYQWNGSGWTEIPCP